MIILNPKEINYIFLNQKLRAILHNIVVINSKIFIEKGYDNYEPRNNYNITFIDICNNFSK